MLSHRHTQRDQPCLNWKSNPAGTDLAILSKPEWFDAAEAQIVPGSWDLPVSIPQGNCRVFSVLCWSKEQDLKWMQLSRLWPKIEWVLSVSSVTELKCRQIKQPDTQNLKMMIGLFQVSSHLYTNRAAWFDHSDNVTAAIKDNLLSSFRTKSLLASQYDVLRVSMSKLWGQKSALLLNLSVS